MPRESVRSQFDTPDMEQPELSASWGRDQEDVQVGVALGPVTVRYLLSASLEASGADLTPEQTEKVLAALTEPHAPALGWYTHLDRGGVNRFIRILRRARDQAFGADE